MSDDANKDELAALKAGLERTQARIAELEARTKPAPAPPSEADIARYNDERRAWSEARASQIPPWMREAVRGGVSDSDARGIANARHAPQGPSTQTPQDFKEVRPRPARPPGGGTGWLEPTPLSPPPGVAQADRLMDEQDRRDRAERIAQERRRREYEEQIDREVALRLALKERP